MRDVKTIGCYNKFLRSNMGKDKSSIQNKFLEKMFYIVFIAIGLRKH